MSPILATIASQFNYAAPSTLTVGGKSFNRKGGVYDNAAGVVRFDFVGRKQRGAFMADKVVVSVSYNDGADLYNVKIEKCDGASFDVTTIKECDGMYAECFATLAEWVH